MLLHNCTLNFLTKPNFRMVLALAAKKKTVAKMPKAQSQLCRKGCNHKPRAYFLVSFTNILLFGFIYAWMLLKSHFKWNSSFIQTTMLLWIMSIAKVFEVMTRIMYLNILILIWLNNNKIFRKTKEKGPDDDQNSSYFPSSK